VRDEVAFDRTVEHDHAQIAIGLDQRGDRIQLGQVRRPEDVERGVVEDDAPIAGGTALEMQLFARLAVVHGASLENATREISRAAADTAIGPKYQSV
jgi:hypothetical protein